MRQFFISLILCISSACFAQSDSYKHATAEQQANEGIELLNQRRFNEAYPLLMNAWAFYEHNKALYEVDYANLAHTIGQYHMLMGAFEKAEDYYAIAVDILKKTNIDDYVYRSTLSDLAWLYYRLHNYDKSNRYFSDAKYLYEKNLDLGYRYGNLLSNYAILQSEIGNSLWAKMFVDMAKDIFLESGKKESEEMAIILDNVASTYNKLGFRDDAISTMLQALEIMETAKITYGMSEMLNNMGAIYFEQKKYEEALSYFQKAFNLDHSISNIIGSGMNLAWVQYILKDKRCLNTSQTLCDSIISDVMRKFTFLSNEERELYWIYNNVRLSLTNTICANSNDKRYVDIIYNNAIFSKGLLLKTTNQIKRDLLKTGDKNSIALLEKITTLEKDLGSKFYRQEQIEAINDSIIYCDRLLTRNNSNYDYFKKSLMPEWEKVKDALDKKEAAIEFVQIPIVEDGSLPEFFINRYYALIAKKNVEHPILVPLCTEEDLKDIITNKSHVRLDRYIRNLYTTGYSQTTSGKRLYDCIWGPLEEHLKGINTIYYSPVGQLNSVSFGALMKDSLVLADCYSLHLLSSTAEVSDIKQDTNNTIGDAVVYGGIEYDVSDETMLAEARGYDSGNKLFTPLVIDETTRSGWNFLPGTEYEAKNIYAMLDSIGIRTIMYTGSKANEESFKSLSGQSPRLMHIATHGFFLSDPKQVATNPFVQSQENNGQSNFLLRSGLLFAGANKTWVNGANVKGIDDGVLTAEEISKLDLANTQTVVLSACETGLGEVISNEGVFGLQRAFKLAGTQTLIMSLWKVPDVPTSKLMILFYKNWSSGMDVHKAFSEAQKDIKKEFPSPYYWAGFVMLD